MGFYLFQGRYTAASLKALIDNPQDREKTVAALIAGVGGKLHHLFFAFGSEDVYALIEAPDDAAMIAGSLIVGASGSMSSGGTIKLLSMAEAMEGMRRAQKARASYAPPA